MAKHGRTLFGRIDDGNALGTLATKVVIAAGFGDAVGARTFALSMKATWTMVGITPGEGPIAVGVAHSDYSAAEIEEWIENNGGWDEGDLIGQEQAKRKIRQVGVFNGVAADEVLNDGKPIRTGLKFYLQSGDNLQQWAYNLSSSTLTTGAQVEVLGTIVLKPS